MKINAIKIDVFKRKIYRVSLSDSLNSVKSQLQCEFFTAIYPNLSGDNLIYLDDEGLINGVPKGAFSIIGYYGVFAGNGLVVGYNSEGNTLDCTSTLLEIQSRIQFEPIESLPTPSFQIIKQSIS